MKLGHSPMTNSKRYSDRCFFRHAPGTIEIIVAVWLFLPLTIEDSLSSNVECLRIDDILDDGWTQRHEPVVG